MDGLPLTRKVACGRQTVVQGQLGVTKCVLLWPIACGVKRVKDKERGQK